MDLKEFSARQAEQAAAGQTPAAIGGGGDGPSGFTSVGRCRKPVIAAIDGYCLAGGFELAIQSDIRVASRKSVFGLPEARRSILAGPGLTQLPRMIPLAEALRIALTGAADQFRAGLADRHHPGTRRRPRGGLQGGAGDRG